MKSFQLFADKIETSTEAGLKCIIGSGNVVLTWSDDSLSSISRNELASHIGCDKITIFKRK
jgi:hypothetical protein